MKTSKTQSGEYFVAHAGRSFVVRREVASDGYNLKSTSSVWDLFEVVNSTLDWINDFPTKRDAIGHIQCLYGKSNKLEATKMVTMVMDDLCQPFPKS